ncbi:sulfotransferase 1B1-like isoform X2 [Haliotis rubra]|uniref:sulfotransferase 1B1-like isoform X2 n=1 Tax=Haliotis rubra TaxID=36100 RepID=UPI001EE5FA5A|nr:sulfotransferase 1B1-like isoform X2 [Haliotis rubra]
MIRIADMPLVKVSPMNAPQFELPVLEVDSVRYPFFYNEDIVRNMPEVTCRDDDVMLCGHIRSDNGDAERDSDNVSRSRRCVSWLSVQSLSQPVPYSLTGYPPKSRHPCCCALTVRSRKCSTRMYRSWAAVVIRGTHWCYEIVNMLLSKSTASVPHTKHDLHVESVDLETLDSRTSPRVLNGHMQFNRLPKQVTEKRVKIIYLLRDPRDVAVSWYQLMEKNFRYRGGLSICPFPDWLKLFCDGELEWGSWFDHVTSWERAMLQHEDHPFLVVHYEDLISDPRREVIRMNEFLGTEADDEFCEEVAAACQFSNMKENKCSITQILNGETIHYNKGHVGSWRSWFTLEMISYFNQVYQKKMRYTRIHSKYM